MSFTRLQKASALAVATLALAASVHAEPSKLASGDRHFAEMAAQDGMAEVALGNVAQQHAAHEQVKQFGTRMAADHAKAGDELKQIAASKGIALPSAPTRGQQHDIDKLSKKSGADFDKAYTKDMVADHKKAVSAFEKQAKSGKDPELKAFAEKTLPTLREHLQMAQAAEDAVKKSK